jgi:enamine deaminase RidA (YjgF/YER057c/UK114 family)
MATIDNRFETLKNSPAEPKDASIVKAHRIGKLLYVSGQVPFSNGVLIASGKVGKEIDMALARKCAWQCASNVVDAVKDNLGSLTKVKRVIRLAIYVASLPEFTDQHLVAHGASSFILEVFGETVGAHIRTAIGVAVLPLDSPVEVDAIFEFED